jgi:hypothetical protein
MTIEGLAPYLAGPGAGLLICVMVGAGVYKLLRDAVVPMIERSIERHLAQVDEMSRNHSTEHMRILDACDKIDRKVGGVLGRMDRTVTDHGVHQ